MRIGQNRLFTVGIGSAPNSYFMQRAAELGRGSFTYIGNTQKVGETMQALFRKIEHPMARDLSVSWDRFPDTDHQVDAYPGRLPDLYDGEPVILAARIKNGGASLQNRSLTISGRIGSLPWQRKVDLASAHPIKGAGTLWGRARIADLMMSLHRGAESKSVRKAVTVTALRHHIVSRYTSLVAVEKTITRPADEPLFPRSVPRNLPDGWDFEKVFGEDLKSRAAIADPAAGQAQNRSAVQSASKKMAHAGNNMALLKRPSAPMVTQGQTILLPAGSTSAGLNLIAGLFALLMGLVLIRLKRST
jgi:Ca-activated chloride channel family protein